MASDVSIMTTMRPVHVLKNWGAYTVIETAQEGAPATYHHDSVSGLKRCLQNLGCSETTVLEMMEMIESSGHAETVL